MNIQRRMRRYSGEFVDGNLAGDCLEAAERIEQLEHALMEIGGIVSVSNHNLKAELLSIFDISCKALSSAIDVPSGRPFPYSDGDV